MLSKGGFVKKLRYIFFKRAVRKLTKFFKTPKIECTSCGSDSVLEEVFIVRGHRPGFPSEWKQINQHCRSCGNINSREEF
jgi:hypothetical protein